MDRKLAPELNEALNGRWEPVYRSQLHYLVTWSTRGRRPVLKDRHVAAGVRLMVVPGSDEVKREAEQEGLSEIFKAAGAEWREAGCSMCIAMNGDRLERGQYAVSTSNRNFEGRQGKGGRTVLASPLTAAASAIAGAIADPRRYI